MVMMMLIMMMIIVVMLVLIERIVSMLSTKKNIPNSYCMCEVSVSYL